MADAVRRAWPEAAPELAVPVPVTRRKRARKGFNQAALLAEALARELNIPCVKALVKCRETRPQKELAAWQRSGNLLGAFDVRPARRWPANASSWLTTSPPLGLRWRNVPKC